MTELTLKTEEIFVPDPLFEAISKLTQGEWETGLNCLEQFVIESANRRGIFFPVRATGHDF